VAISPRVARWQTNGVSECVGRARAFAAERFPSAGAAFLGDSTASGHAAESSDLDVLVVLPQEWADVSFVETTMFRGQLVEAFVYGRAALKGGLKRVAPNDDPCWTG
jgi:hypothetical protein